MNYEGVRLTHQTSESGPKPTWAPQRKIEANDPRGWSALHWLRGALCFAPSAGKANAVRATGPAIAALEVDRALPQLPLAGPQQSAGLVLTLSVVSLSRLGGGVTEQRVQRRFAILAADLVAALGQLKEILP